jgi:hypothetical protein
MLEFGETMYLPVNIPISNVLLMEVCRDLRPLNHTFFICVFVLSQIGNSVGALAYLSNNFEIAKIGVDALHNNI